MMYKDKQTLVIVPTEMNQFLSKNKLKRYFMIFLRRTALLFFSLWSAHCLLSQTQTLIIPERYESSLSTTENQSNITFYAYPYLNSKVDIRSMKKKHPALVVEDIIHIVPPDFSSFSDSTLLIGVMDEHLGAEAKLIIWAAGNYWTNKVTFFIDKTLDRNFLNDSKPIVKKAGHKAKLITIYPTGFDGPERELQLFVPKKDVNKYSKYFTKPMAKIRNGLYIGGHLGFGVGKMDYIYDNNTTGFPGWYDVTLAEKYFGMSIGYNLPSFKIGITSTYQNIFQYTSRFNLRIDEEMIFRNPNTGEKRVLENVKRDINLDIHSKHRIQLGITMAYRWHIGKSIELQPTVTGGKIFYLNGKYIFNKVKDPQITFNQPSDYFMGATMKFEFVTGMYKAMNLGLSFNNVWWRPDGYFESFDGENISKNYQIWSFTVGYDLGL